MSLFQLSGNPGFITKTRGKHQCDSRTNTAFGSNMSLEKIYETLQQVLHSQNELAKRIDRIQNVQDEILSVLKSNPAQIALASSKKPQEPSASTVEQPSVSKQPPIWTTKQPVATVKQETTPTAKSTPSRPLPAARPTPSRPSSTLKSTPARPLPTAKPTPSKPLPTEVDKTPKQRHQPLFHSTPSSSADLSAAFPEFPSPLPFLSDKNNTVVDLGQIYSFCETESEVNNEQFNETRNTQQNVSIRSPLRSFNPPNQPITFRKTFKCAVKSPNISTIAESPEYSFSKNSQCDSESSENNNNNLPGRRQRRAATSKVASYKEPSLIKKMRRNF
uniref:Shugoshin_C domain-containing protein n=1 Tax=Panagrellus redivivus TaxID=6233 RepID=A0A7E4VDS7_PANRE